MKISSATNKLYTNLINNNSRSKLWLNHKETNNPHAKSINVQVAAEENEMPSETKPSRHRKMETGVRKRRDRERDEDLPVAGGDGESDQIERR